MQHRLRFLPEVFLFLLLGVPTASGLRAGQGAAPAASAAPGRPAAVVWQPGVIKGYQFRRYVDPAQPRLLHGGHTVWRREDDGGWVLSPTREEVATGPSAGVLGTRSRPAPLAVELAAELARQRAASAEVAAGVARFKETQEALAREAAEVARLARELKARLPGQSEAEVRARAALQAELRRLSERLERLEKAAPPQSIAPPRDPAVPASAQPTR